MEKFQVAISPQPVVRSTSCFVLGWGFSGTADLMALFSIRINSRWRPPPSWIISNGHISSTAYDLLIKRASRGHLCDSTAFLLSSFLRQSCLVFTNVTSALKVFLKCYALYKSMHVLLTYLLTYIVLLGSA